MIKKTNYRDGGKNLYCSSFPSDKRAEIYYLCEALEGSKATPIYTKSISAKGGKKLLLSEN